MTARLTFLRLALGGLGVALKRLALLLVLSAVLNTARRIADLGVELQLWRNGVLVKEVHVLPTAAVGAKKFVDVAADVLALGRLWLCEDETDKVQSELTFWNQRRKT